MSATPERQLTERETKALQIAAKSKLTRKGGTWTVPSQTGHGKYQVNLDPDFFNCTCPDHEYTQARCKHIYAVEYVLERETTADGQTVVTETVKVTRKLKPELSTAKSDSIDLSGAALSEINSYRYGVA